MSSSPSVSRETPSVWSTEDWLARMPALLSECDLALCSQQTEQLAGYMVMLQQWNSTYNLTALRAPQDMLTHHLADCLVVVAPLLRRLGQSFESMQARQMFAPMASDVGAVTAVPTAPRLLDVGSGGGLPGVVLAIVCPALAVTCVDTVGKKAAFVRQVAAELALPNLRAEHARVEALKGRRFDVVASRAFASLPDFVQWTAHLLAPETGLWMAMKGKQPDDELAALEPGLANLAQVDAMEPLQVPGLDAERCIVWMRGRGLGSEQG